MKASESGFLKPKKITRIKKKFFFFLNKTLIEFFKNLIEFKILKISEI